MKIDNKRNQKQKKKTTNKNKCYKLYQKIKNRKKRIQI